MTILGNCTHVSLALALRKSGLFSWVQSLALYTLPAEHRAAKAAELADADCILTLDLNGHFGPLATKTLRSLYPGKVTSVPTPFFSGLLPDMTYLRQTGQTGRAQGVLGDYHSALILADCQSGLPQGQVVNRYVSGQASDRLDMLAICADSLAELQTREQGTDLAISSYIRSQMSQGLLAGQFLSFNHPTEGLINHIAQAFVTRVLGNGPQIPPILPAEHNLYGGAHWPLHPVVAAALGLQPQADPRFKSPNPLGARHFSIREFAQHSVQTFMDAGPQSFDIATPDYVKKHIKPLDYGPTTTTP